MNGSKSALRRERFSGICFYCGEQKYQLTIDHKRPRALNGSMKRRNLVLACKPCNQEKGKLTAGEYISWRSKQGLTLSREARFFIAQNGGDKE